MCIFEYLSKETDRIKCKLINRFGYETNATNPLNRKSKIKGHTNWTNITCASPYEQQLPKRTPFLTKFS